MTRFPADTGADLEGGDEIELVYESTRTDARAELRGQATITYDDHSGLATIQSFRAGYALLTRPDLVRIFGQAEVIRAEASAADRHFCDGARAAIIEAHKQREAAE